MYKCKNNKDQLLCHYNAPAGSINALKVHKFVLKTKWRLDFLTKKQHNTPNITVTLSARKSNAKPWRFFYASNINPIFGGCCV